MSDNKPLADAPGQQAAADARISKGGSQQADAKADARAANLVVDAADPVQAEEEARVKAEADAAARAEAGKASRAKAGTTGAENGDMAATAFGPRIAAAQFEHRNQGHDDTMQLIDDLFAAVQRLEARAAGGKG
jgi:hypothetical protein